MAISKQFYSEQDIRGLKTISYYAGGRFGSFPAFFNSINSLKKVRSTALRTLIQNELSRLVELQKQLPDVATKNTKISFERNYSIILSHFSNLFGEHIQLPKLFLVDLLPKQFSEKPWDAMSVDQKDEDRYEIPAGIYFRAKFLTHPYFEFIISHELVHWTISQFTTEYFPLTNMYEEGLCEAVSQYILLKSKVIDINVLSNLILFNRTLKHHNSLWNNYYRFSKLILQLMNENGFSSIIDIIKQGRSAFQNLTLSEKSCTIHDDILLKLNASYVAAESAIVLTSNEYYLLEKVISTKKRKFILQDIYLDISISEKDVQQAMDTLVERGLIGFIDSHYLQSYWALPPNIKFSCE